MKRKTTKKKNAYFGDVEHKWLATHPQEVAKYAGQYIAVVGQKIVAHGYDFEAVFHKAQKFDDDPLFDKVPDTELVAYGPL